MDYNFASVVCAIFIVFLYKFSEGKDDVIFAVVCVSCLIVVVGWVRLLLGGIDGIRYSSAYADLPIVFKSIVATTLMICYYDMLCDIILKGEDHQIDSYIAGSFWLGGLCVLSSIVGVLFFGYHWVQIVSFSNFQTVFAVMYFQKSGRSIVFSSFKVNAVIVFLCNLATLCLVYELREVFDSEQAIISYEFKDFLNTHLNFFFPLWVYVTLGGIYFKAYHEKLGVSFIKYAMAMQFVMIVYSDNDLRYILKYIPFLKMEVGDIKLSLSGLTYAGAMVLCNVKKHEEQKASGESETDDLA